jgi:hypothetical protein
MALNFGELLGGIGAAIGGTAPQYVQDLKSRKQAELVDREKAMYQDAAIALQLFETKQFEKLDALGMDRMDQLKQFSDAVPNDTLRMLSLNKLGMSGDLNARAQLHAELISANRAGQVKGYLSAPEQVKGVEVAGELRNPFTGELLGAPAAAPVQTQTSKQKEAHDVASRYGVAGSPEYEKAYMEYMNRAGQSINIGDDPKNFEQKIRNELYGSRIKAIPDLEKNAAQIINLSDEAANMAALMNETDPSLFKKGLLKYMPNLAIATDERGFAAAATAIQNKLAPAMRPEGSGSTSDLEVGMYINSLPNFMSSPDGRNLTVEIFKARAGIERKKLALVEKYSNEGMDAKTYSQELSKLNGESIFTEEVKNRINTISPNFFQTQQTQFLNTNPLVRPL